MWKTQIKASHISNLTDARYFAAQGVKWLSFQLDPDSENYISNQQILAIKEWVEGPLSIGAFGLNVNPEDIKKQIETLKLDGIEVDMHYPVAALRQIVDTYIIQEIIIENNSTIDAVENFILERKGHVDAFQFNFEKNGISWESLSTTNPISKVWLQKLGQQVALIMNMDIRSEQLNELLKINPYGICIKGGFEEKVGFKSFEETDELFDALAWDED